MIFRRNLLQGLAAGAAIASMTPRSALAVADTSIRRARRSVKNLKASVIACEESEILSDNNILDYWTYNFSDIRWLPVGCRKVVISGDLISPASAVQDLAEIYQSIPESFDFDPLESPNHCALHVDGVTDLQEQIRSVLATKSKRVTTAKIALVSEDSCCPFPSDWSRILPMLRTHYDRIISISDVGDSEESEFYDAEFEAYRKMCHKQIAAHCDISVRLPLPDYFADEFDDKHTANLIYEIVDSLLRKTPAEISALRPCGDIPLRDWMTLVA
jgi:hypothetical protein